MMYRNKKVLITGGLGFLGSSLAEKLVALGAKVTILDFVKKGNKNAYNNIQDIRNKIDICIGDIRDKKIMEEVVRNKDIIFNFAAKVNNIDSINTPLDDLDINCKGQLVILESVKKVNPTARIIYSSSRLVIGKPNKNPVRENHPTDPLSLYGIHKLIGEKYHQLYFREFGIPTVIVRITNPYGPKQQVHNNRHSLPGWFTNVALNGGTINIFGTGKQIRDYIYISDLVDAFVSIGIAEDVAGQIFNCGSGVGREFKKLVELIVKNTGKGTILYTPWPKNFKNVETGDYIAKISKIKKYTGWTPKISLEEGVRLMIMDFKKNKDKYLQ